MGKLVSGALIVLAVLSGCAPSVIERGPTATADSLGGDVYTATDGETLDFKAWWPEEEPKAVLIAVHGMNEYSRAFEWPAEAWQDQGVAVYALDQRGFGASEARGIWPGSENMTEDLAGFTRQVKARHPELPLFLLGESMGGGVVMLTAARERPLPIDGLVLVAPAITPWDELPVYWRVPLWLMAHSVPWLPMTGRGLDLRPTDNIEVWRAMSEDELVIRETRIDAIYGLTRLMDKASAAVPENCYATLLLYGGQDDFVRSWMVSWVVENAPNGHFEVINYPEGYHWLLRDLEAHKVLADVLLWMTDRASESTDLAQNACPEEPA